MLSRRHVSWSFQYFAHEDAAAVQSELYEPMLKIVAYNGNHEDYARITSFWQRCKTPERKQSTLMALSMFQDPVMIDKTLKMSLTSKVERQDAPLLVAAIMEERAGRGLAWEFVRKHIIRIAWRRGDLGESLDYLKLASVEK